MLKKTINVCDKEVVFRASATIPRLYRAIFGRDIFKDLSKLSKAKEDNENGETYEIDDLELFENVAYTMAYHGDNSVPPIDEWLDQFEMFSIYEILPEILDLWGRNIQINIDAKKNLEKVAGN